MGGFSDSKANPRNWENPFKRSKKQKRKEEAAAAGTAGDAAREASTKGSPSRSWGRKLNPKHWFD